MPARSKSPGPCPSCDKHTNLWHRGVCHNCYVRLRRQGQITNLPKKALPESLTNKQHQVLVGHLLGDGCLYKHKPTHNPYFCIQRQSRDREYLEWSAQTFQDFLTRPVFEGTTFDTRTSKEYAWSKMKTKQAPVYAPFYEEWYPEGTKVVPRNLVLTPLILAVWFLDDGCVMQHKSSSRIRLKLATMGFSEEDVRWLAQLLKERYKAHFSVNKDNGQFFLSTANLGAQAFVAEIEPFLPPGMSRKMTWAA